MDELVLVPCMVCKNQLINPKDIFKERTQFTRTLFATKLSKIVHGRLEITSVQQPNICGTCESLLNLIDEHESKLLAYENEVRLKFKLPFPIVLEDKSELAPPPLDEQPVTGPDAADPAIGGDLEPGPDDVIVSADETGLVTVTYGQMDADSQASERPAAASSPAVIWDGDSDQQIIIFKEGAVPSVALLDGLPPPAGSGSRDADGRPDTGSGVAAVRQPASRRVFFCDICNAAFSSTHGLAAHREGHDRLRFRCGFCGERCATTVGLSRHMNADHADLLLPCDRCHKRFPTRAGLAQHCKQHEARRHCCSLCMRRFVTLHDLQLHATYKHSDARPFSCDICRRTFKTRTMLRRHKLRHTGLKPHSCSHCGMTFTHKFAMENHAATHVDQLHECATCGRKFGQRRSAEQHVRLMHSELAFSA